ADGVVVDVEAHRVVDGHLGGRDRGRIELEGLTQRQEDEQERHGGTLRRQAGTGTDGRGDTVAAMLLRQTQLVSRTVREASKEDVSINAQLLVRAGFVDKLFAGVYSYLPLGVRV